jgi:hypothetical protein
MMNRRRQRNWPVRPHVHTRRLFRALRKLCEIKGSFSMLIEALGEVRSVVRKVYKYQVTPEGVKVWETETIKVI